MKKKKNLFGRFIHADEGVTALEYGLIAGLIAVMIIGGATSIGTNLKTLFTNISGQVSTAAANASSTS